MTASPAQWKEFSTVIKATTVFAFLVKLRNGDSRKKIEQKRMGINTGEVNAKLELRE